MNLTFLVPAIFGYLLGSVPFGLLLSKAFKLGDIRKIGSGNIGATNVLRTGNKWVALLTVICDMLKATIAVLIARYFMSYDAGLLAGFAAIIGHNFPIWLDFKGGKGVASTFGYALSISPWLFIVMGATWLITVFISKISSLSALVTMIVMPIAGAILTENFDVFVYLLALSALSFYRHRENIKRIRNKTESKIKLSKHESK